MKSLPHVNGVFRVASNARELSLIFDRRPSDDDVRIVHELLNNGSQLLAEFKRVACLGMGNGCHPSEERHDENCRRRRALIELIEGGGK